MAELDNSELFNVEIAADPKPRSFSPAEMVTCEACLRANPPTRPSCLYCGERLLALEPVAAPPRWAKWSRPKWRRALHRSDFMWC